MPSLASEESPTGGIALQRQRHGDWQHTLEPINTPSIETLPSSEQTAVNALLMAARAMTGMTEPHYRPTSADKAEAKTPPLMNGNENDGTPNESIRTAQRNLLGEFTSPKRKADETVGTSDDPSSRIQMNQPMGTSKLMGGGEYQGDETFEDGVQFTKRSRLAGLGKDVNNDGQGDANVEDDAMVMSTPAKGRINAVGVKELTPVSARCLDFKNMSVSDMKGSSARS
jgi:hypothetical protein